MSRNAILKKCVFKDTLKVCRCVMHLKVNGRQIQINGLEYLNARSDLAKFGAGGC